MMPAEGRTYGQRCGLAASLDLLGERWTLLILRELSRGPKRFGDLLEGLDGIGGNLLSARLKKLPSALTSWYRIWRSEVRRYWACRRSISPSRGSKVSSWVVMKRR